MSKNRLNKKYLLKKFTTTDELINYLNELTDFEIEKADDEMDCDMISECDKWLLELQGIEINQIKLSKREIKKRVKVISDKYYKTKKQK